MVEKKFFYFFIIFIIFIFLAKNKIYGICNFRTIKFADRYQLFINLLLEILKKKKPVYLPASQSLTCGARGIFMGHMEYSTYHCSENSTEACVNHM